MTLRSVRYPHVLSFRLDTPTLQLLIETAGLRGQGPSEYARSMILRALKSAMKAPPTRRAPPHAEELRALIAELGKQGSNLNQVAKQANLGAPSTALREMIDALQADHAAALDAVVRALGVRDV